MGQVGQEGVVVGGLVADGQTAGLVVGSDQDQGLIGVLAGKIHRSLHGIAQFQHIVDGSGGIVGMAGPVDLAGLGHQEEALGVVQQFDALLHIVGQLPLAVGGIQGVVHGLAVRQVLGDDEGLACTGSQGSGVGLGGDHVIAGLCGNFVVVGAGAVTVHLLELAAGKVLKAGVCQLHADLIVVLAAVLVGIERSRGGVVDVDGGDHAHLIALLAVQLLSDGLIGHIAGPGAHIDDTALGLVAGGDGGRGRSGVRAEGSAVVGGHAAHLREAGEAQVGFGDSAVVVHGTLVEAGRLDLCRAHAVADEQEDVFGLLDEAVLLLGLSLRSVCSVCCHRGGGHHAQRRCYGSGFQKTAAGDLVVFHNAISSL